MPVYNAASYVGEAVKSVLSQTFQDFELVIVNDGSTDLTSDIIDLFRDNQKIRSYVFPRNRGYAMAMNKAASLAKGEYLAIQDGDDISLPTRLEEEVKVLDKHLDVELVYSHVLEINQDGKVMRKRGGISKDDTIINTPDAFYRLYIEGNFIPNPTIMMRRRHLNRYLYRPDLPTSNDLEHKIRVAHDYSIYEVTKPLVKLRRGHKSMSSNQKLSLETEHRIIQLLYEEYKDKKPKISFLDYRRALSNHYVREAKFYGRIQKEYSTAVQKVFTSLLYYPLQVKIWKYVVSAPFSSIISVMMMWRRRHQRWVRDTSGR